MPQSAPKVKPRIFFGWYIIGLMIIAMMLVYGIRLSFSVFFKPILDEFGWFRGVTAIMLSLNILVYGLAAPVSGFLVDRWKPRNVVVLGLCTISLGTAACFFARELWHFYLLFGVVIPIGTAFCGSPVLNPALINWFGKRRGMAVGLGQIGGGLSFVYILMVEAVIATWGWRASFLVMAGLVIIVLLPLYLIFYYHRPEDKKIPAYGVEELSAGGAVKEAQPPLRDWTLGTALRSYQLWMLVLSEFCLWGLGNYMILAHQVKFAEDVGFSSLLAASAFALFGFASIGGQLCSSFSDKIGREITLTISTLLAIGGLIALISVRDASQLWLLYLYSISSGFATGVFSPVMIVGTADIFRGRNISTLTALLMTGSGLGGAIGPWLGGYIYDKVGSYHIAFVISMAAFVVGTASFWLAAPRNSEKLRARLMKPVEKPRYLF
jgi:MFS family permease